MRSNDLHTGPHYYVLSLSRHTNALLEAFRDTLIDVENGGFPVVPAHGSQELADSGGGDERARDTLRAVDRYFAAYHGQEPLKLVVVGESEMLSMFSSVTAYRHAVVGRVVGDYSATSLRDLGKIVWPVVKDAMSGVQDKAMRDLDVARQRRKLVYGIESVSRAVVAAAGATLLVEGDYHVRGSLYEVDETLTLSHEVDVTAAMDDVVDIVIEKTLAAGGHVVFVPSGALTKLKRIALLLADDETTRR